MLEDLKSAIQDRKVLCIVGQGVSVEACGPAQPCASRRGLMESGLRYCLGLNRLDEAAYRLYLSLLDGVPEGAGAVANVIMNTLGRAKGDLQGWLRTAHESLHAQDQSVLAAIAELHRHGVILATTALDNLLASQAGLPWVTWSNDNECQLVLSKKIAKVLHLCGHFSHHSSVVLPGTHRCEDWLKRPFLRDLIQSSKFGGTLLLVGFEPGEQDPLLQGLQQWSSNAEAELERRHFRLVRSTAVEQARAEHHEHERVFVHSYGNSPAELAGLLRELAGGSRVPRDERSRPFALGAVAPVQPPAGVLSFEAAAGQLHVILPRAREGRPAGPRLGRVSFTAAAPKLSKRVALDTLLAELASFPCALVEGPAGSGKTTMALQLADRLCQGDCPPQLAGTRVYYARPAEDPGTQIFDFLELQTGPTLLILDDVHEEEQVTRYLLGDWEMRWDPKQNNRVRLLLLTQSQELLTEEDDDDPRELVFYLFHHVIHALPDRTEFSAILDNLWALAANGPLPEALRGQLTAFARSSPALASLAIDASQEGGWTDEAQFRRALVRSLKEQYQIGAAQEKDVRRACVFSALGIPIVAAAFGADRAAALRQKMFLVGAGHQHLAVFSKTVSELIFEVEVEVDPERDLVDIFVPYIKGESNYHQVLAALSRARQFGLLKDIINQSFVALKRHLSAERDLYRSAVALESIVGSLRTVARKLLDHSLEECPLGRRILDEPPVRIARYLAVATRSDRRLFSPPDEGQPGAVERAANAHLALEYMTTLVARPELRLDTVADICEAVGRSSRPAAVGLISKAIQTRGLTTEPPNAIEAEARLIFAGRISWIDYQKARPLVGDSTLEVLLKATGPRGARRVILSLAKYSVRRAREDLVRLPRSSQYRDWLHQIVAPPTNLHDVGTLINLIGQISRRTGRRIAEDIYLPLQSAIERDPRLTAVGYLLQRLGPVNDAAARNLLEFLVQHEILIRLMATDTDPVHFGKTVESIGRISKDWISSHLDGLQANEWIALFRRARTLGNAAVLLRGVSRASRGPDQLIARLLESPIVKIHLRALAQGRLVAVDLSNFARSVEADCPISQPTRDALRRFVSPGSFERTLREEENPRRAGDVLRAYGTAFPDEAAAHARTIAGQINLKDRKQAGKAPNVWLRCDDLSGIAHLLHAACDVDGHLGDRLGASLDMRFLTRHLQAEPKSSRVAEFLQSLALVAPEKAQKLLHGLYQNDDPIRLLQTGGTLRETAAFLGGVHAAGYSFYQWWMRRALDAPRVRASLLHELRAMCAEEGNLGTLSSMLRLLSVVDRRLAPELLSSLDRDWLVQVAEWDNNIIQVLQFVATVARCTSRSAPPRFVSDLINRQTLARLGGVRSIRTFALGVVELLQVSAAMNRPGLVNEGSRYFPLDQVRRALDASHDIVGCAQLGFLLHRIEPNQEVRQLIRETEQAVRDHAPSSRATSALLALALVGAGTGDDGAPGSISQRLTVESTDVRMWHLGFANWVRACRAARTGMASGLLMPRERLPIDSWRDERFGSSLQQELQLVGGNLRFAFTAALADQLGWPVSRPEYEALQKRAAQRARFEPVFSVRTMLQTVAGEPLSGEQGEDYVPEVSVFYYLRRLMPRIEEVAPNSG